MLSHQTTRSHQKSAGARARNQNDIAALFLHRSCNKCCDNFVRSNHATMPVPKACSVNPEPLAFAASICISKIAIFAVIVNFGVNVIVRANSRLLGMPLSCR